MNVEPRALYINIYICYSGYSVTIDTHILSQQIFQNILIPMLALPFGSNKSNGRKEKGHLRIVYTSNLTSL